MKLSCCVTSFVIYTLIADANEPVKLFYLYEMLYKVLYSFSSLLHLGPVYMAPDKFVSGQIIMRIRFAFTRHYPIRTSF